MGLQVFTTATTRIRWPVTAEYKNHAKTSKKKAFLVYTSDNNKLWATPVTLHSKFLD